MAGRLALGLRMQIVVAVCAALALAFLLLGSVALRLSERARDHARRGYAVATAESIALGLRSGPLTAERFAELADPVIGRGATSGVELHLGAAEPHVRGVSGFGVPVDAEIRPGASVRVWVERESTEFDQNVRTLFILYVGITGAGILIFAYTVLTYLIVRPIDALIRASERVAAGQLAVSVPSRGATEVARLSRAFNAMAAQLRTDRAALEMRLLELTSTTKELEAAQEQVVRSAKLASVGRLAAGVAHEIGNPLSAILGLVELVRTGGLSPADQSEFLRRIESETERINVIIRDLLDFSRAGTAGAPVAEGDADLVEVVEDAVKLVGPQKDLRRIDIERRFDDRLPRVRGLAARHTQILLNLLLNAADALPDGGEIRVEVTREDDVVRLTVADTGPGIPEHVLGQLFEPFVTTKPVGKGTGLGLAVCHTIVDQLGGTIRAENPKEGGARFEVRLPAIPDPTENQR
jgi:two-component system, NtrC family, sensor kinase